MVFFLASLFVHTNIYPLKFTSTAYVALSFVFVVLYSIISFGRLIKGKNMGPWMLPNIGTKMTILDLLVVIPVITKGYIFHFNV